MMYARSAKHTWLMICGGSLRLRPTRLLGTGLRTRRANARKGAQAGSHRQLRSAVRMLQHFLDSTCLSDRRTESSCAVAVGDCGGFLKDAFVGRTALSEYLAANPGLDAFTRASV